jgi:Co/Zn/Cd efflux system component
MDTRRYMAGCCESGCEIDSNSGAQRVTLWIVLFINFLMFFVLVAGSIWGKTVSLYAESFDNLGDAITYGVSIWAVGKGVKQKAKVSLFKGFLILLGAFSVLAGLIYKWVTSEVPTYEIMGGFAIVSLFANLICLGLLWRHRNEDINMESVWHCSRNDIVTNSSVIVASGLVWYFNSWIPDIVLGSILFLYLSRSGITIINKSIKQMKDPSN